MHGMALVGHGHYVWWIRALHTYGYLALFGLIGLQDLGVPTVVPGAAFLVVAGYLASQGVLNPVVAVLVAAIASLLGGTVLFGFSRWGGAAFARSFGRVTTIDAARRERLERWLLRWGLAAWIAFRLVPGFRCALSIVSGFSGMSYRQFLLLSGVSALVWASAFVWLGVALGPHWGGAVSYVLASGPLALVVLVVAALVFGWRNLRARRASHEPV
ncbi:MAG TPA: DedA family protein [Ktedonobacterales bacterium]|jgi:membrane protein DedA with SNARE-associated domain